jgi:hypothetical protein
MRVVNANMGYAPAGHGRQHRLRAMGGPNKPL